MQRLAAAAVVLVFMLLAAPSAGAAAPALDVYTGTVPSERLDAIVGLGIDRHELQLTPAARGTVRVETILSRGQAAQLRRAGVALAPKEIGGQTAAQRATAAAAALQVFRPYSGAGGLKQEFEQVAAAHRRITKLVSVGRTLNGQDIVALKVSRDARDQRDGRKPAVLYLGAQHAREWITPEMVRRLMHRFVDGYDTDPAIRRLVDQNELWFLPVANPDGYDFTFQDGQRLWRKNLRDNNGDGQITAGDGVDLNRNFPTKWGYDNEGSSDDPGSETFRGASAGSEPETRALDAFARRVGFEFIVNYHSAAELLLYGTGWQVATPTPDDVLYEAMAGDDAQPAVPGYDPDISAELYTTNGETESHMTDRYDSLGFTPEMSTCEDASAGDPDDAFEPEACGSVFEFPDSEPLIQAEFEKNIPFAMSVAESADDPDDPASAVGRTAADFRVDSFDVSYGDPQTVAVVAKRALNGVRMRYRIDGGRVREAGVSEWRGGERYGDENDVFYAELRGRVRGTRQGDDVTVWFEGRKGNRTRGERAVHLHGRPRHGPRRARDRQRGLHGRQPDLPGRHDRAEVRRRARRGDPRGRLRRGRLGRRRAGRPARPRRAQPLRRGALVPRRQPHHPGSRGRAHPDAVRPAARHRRRRAPAVPHDRRARLPQRGRQADPRGRDRAVPGPARDQRRRGRSLLRDQRRRDRAVRDLQGGPVLRRLPAPRRRLPPVLPRRLHPRRAAGADRRRRRGGSRRRLRRHARRAGRRGRQPARRARGVPAHERGAAAGRVPAVPQPWRGRVPVLARSRDRATPPRCTRTTRTCA